MKGRGQHVNPLSVEPCIEHRDRLADLILFLHAHRDSFASVQHRSIIPPPEGISNFMQGGFGVAPSQIHRHLARECNIRRATFAGHDTFNTLFDGRKQIVLSSDRPASEIAILEQRLVSRFEWGLTAEFQPPDIETRMAILRKKAEILHVQLSQEILEFLAQRVRTNVRRLEGALMRVASFVSLSGREISRETVEQLLRDILQEEAKKIVTIDQIQKKVAEHFDVRLAAMTSKRRPANIAFP